MKKIFTIFIIIILVLSYKIVYANNSVSITNIEVDDISDNTIINNIPTINGLSFSMDVTFFEVNDFIKYKIEIENDTNEDVTLNNNKLFDTNDHIEYTFSVEGDSIIKAKSTKIMYVTIKYNKEIDSSELNSNGNYNHNNIMQLNIANVIDNPKTGHSNLILSIVSMIMICFGIYMVVKYGKKDTILIIILCLSILPISVFAINQIQLSINTKITIETNTKQFKLCNFYDRVQCSNYRYIEGMTWEEWISSKYNYNLVNYQGNSCIIGNTFIVNELSDSVDLTETITEPNYYIGIIDGCSY